MISSNFLSNMGENKDDDAMLLFLLALSSLFLSCFTATSFVVVLTIFLFRYIQPTTIHAVLLYKLVLDTKLAISNFSWQYTINCNLDH
jgi:hypothetical protein